VTAARRAQAATASRSRRAAEAKVSRRPTPTDRASVLRLPSGLHCSTVARLHNQFVTAAHHTWRARTGVDR
jgi:hypothetical protein